MGLWLLCNTASDEAADLRLTDSSNVKITGAETAGLDNVRGGPRSLKFGKITTDARRIVYLNTSTLMSPVTHFVGVDFVNTLDDAVSLLSFHTYPSIASVDFTSALFNETLCGILGTDWVAAIDNASGYHKAYAVALTGQAAIGQCYFCAGQEFNYRLGGVAFTKVPVWSPAVQHNGNYYKLFGQASFTVTKVTSAEVEAYLDLPTTEPVFFFDDTGGAAHGDFIPHKLWHCIVLGETITQVSDDLYQIAFNLGIMKHGNG